MPITSCQSDKDPGFKWGDAGKCYTYNPKNEGSKNNARKKALAQGIAIGDIKLQGLNVSFDYHDTLTTDKGKKLLVKEMDDKNTIYIISAAQHKSELEPFANKYGIPLSRVFATGSNQKKVDKLKELNIVRHYDNSQEVIDIAKDKEGLKTEIVKV
jgi:hypothetical protein